MNLIHDTQVWGQKTPEWAISSGITKTLVDNLLSIGIESKWTKPDSENYEAIFGHSIQ